MEAQKQLMIFLPPNKQFYDREYELPDYDS